MGQSVACEGQSLGIEFQKSPADFATTVSEKSQDVLSKLEGLKAQAEQLRTKARSALSNALRGLRAYVPDVQLQATISQYEKQSLQLPAAPDLANVDVCANSSLRGSFSLTLAPFQKSTIAAPTIEALHFPERGATALSGSAPTPIDLAALPDVPSPPFITFEVSSIPSLEGLPTLALSPVSVDWAEFLPPSSFDADVPALSADRVAGAVARVFEALPYVYKLLPDALSVAGDILSGGAGYAVEDAHATAHTNMSHALDTHAARLQSVWARRGFVRDDADVRATYTARVAARVSADLDTYQQALVARQRMRKLPDMLQVVVQGHAALVEVKRQLYDAEFALLVAEREAQMQMLATFAQQIRDKVLEHARVSAQYALQVARIKAEVDEHLAHVQAEIAKSKANSARASAYAASQEALAAQVQAYEARYRAALAVVEAYNTMMQTLQTRARLAGAALARFEAQSEAWGTQLAAAQAEYAARSVENRAIVAHNQALATRVRVEGLQSESVAQEAAAAAADISAHVAQLRALLASRMGEYMQVTQHNATVAAKATQAAQANRAAAVNHTVATLPLRADYAASVAINDAVVGVAGALASVASSGAKEVQNNRIQLANAYVSLYRALADAESAIAVGELSNVRADVRITTRGDVSYSAQVAERYEDSRSAAVSHANECVTVYRPMTH